MKALLETDVVKSFTTSSNLANYNQNFVSPLESGLLQFRYNIAFED